MRSNWAIQTPETQDRPEIVCLCGSTKFRDEFMEVAKILTLQGKIVVMPNVFIHQGDTITEEEKKNLDSLHKWKIAMSDRVYIITKDNYIGNSTKSEIEYARGSLIPIEYWNF